MSRNIKYTCGVPLPTACLFFTGEFPSFIPASSVPCDANLDEILAKHFAETEKLIDSVDLSTVNKYNFTFTSNKVKDFVQEAIVKIEELESLVNSLSLLITDLNVGAHTVEIDLKCIAPAAAPCAVGTNQYSLISVLNVLVNEICLIKSHLNL